MASTTFTGQNYGAKKSERVKRGMWVVLAMCVVYTIITGALLLAFAHQVIRLFSQDPEVINAGVSAMRYFCPFYFLLGILHSLATGALLLAFAHQVIRLFSQDPEVINAGVSAMRYFCPFYFLLGILHSLAGTVRGVGKTVPPMIVLFLSLCLFRVICILYVIPMTSINYVYVLYPISWLIGAILMAC